MRDPVAAYKLLRRVKIDWLTIVEYTQMSHYEGESFLTKTCNHLLLLEILQI